VCDKRKISLGKILMKLCGTEFSQIGRWKAETMTKKVSKGSNEDARSKEDKISIGEFLSIE
jgi:hypothetical protein